MSEKHQFAADTGKILNIVIDSFILKKRSF